MSHLTFESKYVNNGSAYVGNGETGNGSVTVSSGTWRNSGYLRVGDSGTGSLLVNGGLVTANIGAIGVAEEGNGSVTVTSGTWSHSAALYVGAQGTGSLLVNGGLVSDNFGIIGGDYFGNGSATVSSGTWSNSVDMYVGYLSTGSLQVDGGLVSVTGTAVIGYLAEGNGTITLSGSSGNRGMLSTSRVMERSGTGTLNFDGGILQAKADQSDFISGFEAGDVTTGTGGAFIDSNNHAIGINTVLSGSGGLTKLGAGTLTLSATNTYTGQTTIADGTLLVNGSLAGEVLVTDNATLGGSGVIGGAVTMQAGGTFSPGNSPGQITLEDSLTMVNGSFLIMEFSGTSDGLYDQLDVQGTFTAGGTLNLMLISGFTPLEGASFTIFNGLNPGFEGGSFTITTNLGGGLAWDTSALGSSGVVSVAPEPAAGLLLLGAAGLLALRRRRSVSRRT